MVNALLSLHLNKYPYIVLCMFIMNIKEKTKLHLTESLQNQSYFEITIDSKEIAPQRMTSPPQARKFKTLAAAYSYLRNFLDYERGITILIAP